MKRRLFGSLSFILFWGCGGTPFLIVDFESNYKPKLKTVAVMPFLLPSGNQLAENQRPVLEEKITDAIVRSDSLHSYLFPYSVRVRLWGMADSAIAHLPADRAGRILSAEALLYCEAIRLHQSEGSNPTSSEVGAAKYQRRGVELLVGFQLVEAVSGKLLWRYRVRRFGNDEEKAMEHVGEEAAKRWPL
jgi:hypothetical protein